MATGDHDDQQRQVVEVGDDGHHQAPPSQSMPDMSGAGILKVKCQVDGCKTMVFRTSTTKLLVKT